jgi:hypothetical protein
MIRELTEVEFKACFGRKMKNVTSSPDASVDIWPYARQAADASAVSSAAVENSSVEYVYRSNDDHYDHVLIPAGRKNVFLVIVVDGKRGAVFGHRILNLNVEYGLEEKGNPA